MLNKKQKKIFLKSKTINIDINYFACRPNDFTSIVWCKKKSKSSTLTNKVFNIQFVIQN